ncbi:MAG: hypothetical protein LBS00_06400, partial [Synergistaceae bacterium]|nr:hypothetical protein [Synergistaceae bacterium]
VSFSAEDVANNREPQFLFSLRRDALEELTTNLPSDTLEGCFCRLYLDAKPMHLSKDPAKVEAFFNAPSPETSRFGPLLWMALTVWPEIDPHFLVRLFKKIYPQMQAEGNKNDSLWPAIGHTITKIKQKGIRDAVADGVCRIMRGDKNKSHQFKETIAFLERLPKLTNAELAKTVSRNARSGIPSLKQVQDLLMKMFKKEKRFYEDDFF